MDSERLALAYFQSLTEDQLGQLLELRDIYVYWNTRINLISRKDIDHFFERHVIHSLCIGKWINFRKDTKVMDLGTGGGFPGIPLAIMFPNSQFTLVDSIGKKIAVVNEVIRTLGLKNTKTEKVRVEEIKDTFDFITARAVADTGKILRWCAGKFNFVQNHSIPNGLILLKGGDISRELEEAGVQTYTVLPLTELVPLSFFEQKYLVYIPCSDPKLMGRT